jgi:type IV pilus assembly protein PilX
MKPLSVAQTISPYRMAATGISPQHGTALVMSLVVLLILTILAVASMSASSLQEKMSGNLQETTRAFQASESGLNRSLSDSGVFDINQTTTKNYDFDNSHSGSAKVETSFVQVMDRKRGSGSGSWFQHAHFDQKSTGTTMTNAKSVVHQGTGLVIPKSN